VRRYLIIIENAGENLSAYSPDLPGCVATGKTRAEVEANMKDAMRMHIEGLRQDALPVPEPRATADYVTM
jgi:predicted RNase H-like HicB family nuclease